MKEDYLWDKSGEDAEIQGLENALKAFRYRETAPPALPAKVLTIEKAKPQRRFFQFGFAFAAFASVIAVFFGVWFYAASSKIPSFEISAETNAPQSNDKIVSREIVKTPEVAPFVKVEDSPRSIKPNVVKARQTLAPVIRRNKKSARTTKVKQPIETLTAEEKYAYDQLMLALSITGSTLKIVKNKIDRIEDQNAVLETTK